MMGISSIMIMASVGLMIIIIYNLGKLNFLENKYNFVIFKSLGFRDKMLRKIYKKEMYIITIVAIIIGAPLSKYLSVKILTSMGSSTDLMYMGKFETKIIAAIIVIITSIVLNNIIARTINNINMVEELKAKD